MDTNTLDAVLKHLQAVRRALENAPTAYRAEQSLPFVQAAIDTWIGYGRVTHVLTSISSAGRSVVSVSTDGLNR
jgi:hypothetical protein